MCDFLGVQTAIITKSNGATNRYLLVDFEAYPINDKIRVNTLEIDEAKWVKLPILRNYKLSPPTFKNLKKIGAITKSEEHEIC